MMQGSDADDLCGDGAVESLSLEPTAAATCAADVGRRQVTTNAKD